MNYEEQIDKMSRHLHEANVDANRFRDALKNILLVCEDNRRGAISQIEFYARQAFGDYHGR